jgi:hypothetical protein
VFVQQSGEPVAPSIQRGSVDLIFLTIVISGGRSHSKLTGVRRDNRAIA